MSVAVAPALHHVPSQGSRAPVAVPVLIRSFDPLPRSLSLALHPCSTAFDILRGFALGLGCLPATNGTSADNLSLCHNGRILSNNTLIASLLADDGFPVTLEIRVLMRGGKGGFGSQLRAAGGKMSAGAKNANNDSCRDLNGRRLGVMKEARKLATYLEGEEERKRQLNEAQKKKYAKLERMLGRKPKNQQDFEEAASRIAEAGESFDDGSASPASGSEAGPSTQRQPKADVRKPDPPPSSAGTKRKERLEDTEYIEQSREIVENVRSAVATAMLKKKKKKQLAPTKSATSATPVESKKATA